MAYRAPVSEVEFILNEIIAYDDISATEPFAEATSDLVSAVLTEAGKLAQDVIAPLNPNGDAQPTRPENGIMRSSPGFAEGFKAMAEGGWIAVAAPQEHGGMGLPQTVAQAVNDFTSGACLSLQLNPLLTQGQIEALEHHASDELKNLYLPKLISGEWSGTMNLSEPQAGSDVGAVATKAEANGDGTYSISGQKIWITWGDADFVENVCHLVLARLPGAPAGTKGISLFLVPRNLPNEDGSAGERNDLRVVSVEEKLGIHGSPTCVMEYSGAKGWLVGPEGGGMAAMFTMMNNARLGVGIQGIGIAEAAYQKAYDYALERKQGRTNGPTGAIFDHADVRRMLARSKSDIFAARCIALACAKAIDMSAATGSKEWAARAAFLTPIAKAFGTDVGVDVSDTGVQIHGGMGYVEETGAAQYLRDVRITPIYEGTNGIQAMDLVGRKLADGGTAAHALLDDIEAHVEANKDELPELSEAVWQAAETVREATDWLLGMSDMDERFAAARGYLRAFARLLGGHFHLLAARSGNPARVKLARWYVERHLPEAQAYCLSVMTGAGNLMDLSPDDLSA
ncbi:MAG: acyl-CoA dehydrogenase [Rhodobacterales bacterium]|nr:MAG: acyl-CoA dehydrogenase [Rhodobacterales bacterium]